MMRPILPVVCALWAIAALGQDQSVSAPVLRERVEKQLTDIAALQAEINSLSQRIGRPITTPNDPPPVPPVLAPEPLPDKPVQPPAPAQHAPAAAPTPDKPAPAAPTAPDKPAPAAAPVPVPPSATTPDPPKPVPVPEPEPTPVPEPTPAPAPEPAPAPLPEPDPTPAPPAAPEPPPAPVVEPVPAPAPPPPPPAVEPPPAPPEPGAKAKPVPADLPAPPKPAPTGDNASTHVLRENETFSSVARDRGLKVADILKANPGLDPKRLRPGQVIRLPGGKAAPGPVAKPASAPQPEAGQSGAATIHTVVPGDTLYSIARRYGTTPESIADANKLANPNALVLGQRLAISGKGGAAPAPARSRSLPPTAGTYRVKAGDTIFGISSRTGTPIEELRRLNKLDGDRILPGQTLKVRRAPAAKDDRPAEPPPPSRPAKPSPTARAAQAAPVVATTPYQVQPGESIFSIARKFFLSQDELAALNRLDRNAPLRAGDRILLPTNAVVAHE